MTYVSLRLDILTSKVSYKIFCKPLICEYITCILTEGPWPNPGPILCRPNVQSSFVWSQCWPSIFVKVSNYHVVIAAQKVVSLSYNLANKNLNPRLSHQKAIKKLIYLLPGVYMQNPPHLSMSVSSKSNLKTFCGEKLVWKVSWGALLLNIYFFSTMIICGKDFHSYTIHIHRK